MNKPILMWLLRLEDSTLSAAITSLSDGAGLTRLGITSANVPNMPAAFWVPSTPSADAIQMALDFYHTHYWVPLGLDSIAPQFAASILSCAVNCGTRAATAILAQSNGNFTQFISRWKQYYQSIALNKPSDVRFLAGWLARAAALYPELPHAT